VDWVAFSPDGQSLASASEDATVKLWRVADGECLRSLFGHFAGFGSVAFSPDGQLLASAGGDRTILLWRVSDGALLQMYDEETGTGVPAVAFSPDGSLMAYGRDDATVVMARAPLLAQAPQDWFVPGWVWFSIPAKPMLSADASDVLGFDATNRIYGWDDAHKWFLLYPNDFTDLAVGPSYLARLAVGEGYTPEYLGTHPGKLPEWTLPAAGWSWVGVPGTSDIVGADVSLSKDGTNRTAAEDLAAPDPWLNWNWVFWDPVRREARIMNPFGGGDDTSFHPWYGYRVWGNTENVTIVFP
jgi:hypothetical protein